MESQHRDEHVLHDLALIYIALAHGADQHLDQAEMDLIAERLQTVQAGVSHGTVLHAVKDAFDDYAQADAPRRIEQAVQRLCESVPVALRSRILRDLTDIGKADDRFLYTEAAFIGVLTEAWKREAAPEARDAGAAWSIFGDERPTGGWTTVHDLTLIYVTLAHRTDGVLSRKEVEAILEKIGEWMPDASSEMLRRILHEVLLVYEQQPEGRTFADAVAAVRDHVPPYQRPAVLADLRYVAAADGVVLVEERLLIEELAQAWNEGPTP